ncbi:hypothetical protein ACLKA6_000750 [Drosophila palustris]
MAGSCRFMLKQTICCYLAQLLSYSGCYMSTTALTAEIKMQISMTDDHFMNPCILIRTDAARTKDEGRDSDQEQDYRTTGRQHESQKQLQAGGRKNNGKPCVQHHNIRPVAS